MLCNAPRTVVLWLVFILTAGLPGMTVAVTADVDPHSVFSAMRTASGGDRWNEVGEIVVEATFSQGGLKGTTHLYRDIRRGLYASRSDVGATRGARGFDGASSWMRDEKGLVSVLDGVRTRPQAITDVYLARNGWFAGAADATATMRYLEIGRAHV